MTSFPILGYKYYNIQSEKDAQKLMDAIYMEATSELDEETAMLYSCDEVITDDIISCADMSGLSIEKYVQTMKEKQRDTLINKAHIWDMFKDRQIMVLFANDEGMQFYFCHCLEEALATLMVGEIEVYLGKRGELRIITSEGVYLILLCTDEGYFEYRRMCLTPTYQDATKQHDYMVQTLLFNKNYVKHIGKDWLNAEEGRNGKFTRSGTPRKPSKKSDEGNTDQ